MSWFDEVSCSPLPPEIPLATRTGKLIPNRPAPMILTATALAQHEARRGRAASWRARKPPCGGYNCFGLAFACRRTAIYDNEAVDLILREDGYRKVSLGEAVFPGDIALYYRESLLLHAGVVVEEQPLRVLSKFLDTGGEEIHDLKDYDGGRSRPELWTDREDRPMSRLVIPAPVIASTTRPR